MTRESNLSIKAKHNYKVANYSEHKKYYEVAISRYYYYLYQNIIDYINTNRIEIIEIENKGIHYKTINTFIRNISMNRDLNDEDLRYMGLLQELRTIRNYADYRNELWNKTEYEKDFKNKFTTLNNIIAKKLQLW